MTEKTLYVSINGYDFILHVEEYDFTQQENPSANYPGCPAEVEILAGWVEPNSLVPENEADVDVIRWCEYPESFDECVEYLDDTHYEDLLNQIISDGEY